MRMDFCDQKMRQQASISVGDAHHFVKSDVLTRCPSGSPMADLLKILRKGARVNGNGLNSKEMQSRDGHSFAYILHYVCTGDLIYPLHEGFHRVDALLKELTYFGLVDDVLRNATQEAYKRRYAVVAPARRSADASERPPLGSTLSVCNTDSLERASRNCAVGSTSDLLKESGTGTLASSRCAGHAAAASGQRRFLSVIKRYLNVKSKEMNENDAVATHPHVVRLSTSASRSHSSLLNLWNSSGNHGGSAVGPSGGVFRPASAQGTTLVLIAAPDYVTVYGQRAELESIFGTDYQVVSLRTTSSAFIDAQLIYQPADAADIVDNERRQQLQQPPLQRHRLRSELLWRLYQQRIRSRGYVITVQTHWRDKATLETHHQWLLHRKSGWKNSSSRRAYLSLTLPSSSSVASAPSAVQNLLGRRASVMQRLFHKSTLSLHTEVTAV